MKTGERDVFFICRTKVFNRSQGYTRLVGILRYFLKFTYHCYCYDLEFNNNTSHTLPLYIFSLSLP